MITYDEEIYLNTTKESLNNTSNELNISPVKVHSHGFYHPLLL